MLQIILLSAQLFADSMSQIVNLEKIKSEQLISLIIVILPQLEKKKKKKLWKYVTHDVISLYLWYSHLYTKPCWAAFVEF